MRPVNPKRGDELWYEEEDYVSQPFEIQAMIGSQNWHNGAGACFQEASEHWLTIETGGAKPPELKPGVIPSNLALGKPARMSSQYSGPDPASSGVDGNLGSMFHTNIEKNPWWQVDLQSSYALSSIVLHNRYASNGDRARTIQVLISQDGNAWTTIYRHDGTEFKDLTVDAGGRSARYVRAQLAESNYLHLLEVNQKLLFRKNLYNLPVRHWDQ